MKAPDPLSAAEQAALDKMGNDTWRHAINGFWIREGTDFKPSAGQHLRGQMIAALWRSGYVELLSGRRARKQDVPGLPDNVIRA